MRVFILDEIVVKPGLAEAFRDAHRKSYEPGAARRGMKLEGAWRNPPAQDFEELPTTLYFMWSLDGVDDWWRMRKSRTSEGADERFEKLRWWQEADRIALSRKRTLLTSLPEGS